jgi:hypothetical protein
MSIMVAGEEWTYVLRNSVGGRCGQTRTYVNETDGILTKIQTKDQTKRNNCCLLLHFDVKYMFLPTKCIFVFHMVLATNTDSFLRLH